MLPYLLGWTGLFLLLGWGIWFSIRRREHEALLALVLVAEIFAFMVIMCMIGFDPGHAIAWALLLAVEVATSILTWKPLLRNCRVQTFADWLDQNEIPFSDLGNAFAHSHNRLLCRQHGAEHTTKI